MMIKTSDKDKFKTPTPRIFVDTITPGCNSISGWVGVIVDTPIVYPAGTVIPAPIFLPNGTSIPTGRYITTELTLPPGTRIPEPEAYVYLYVSGLLINPPVLNPDGSYGYGAVLSNIAGYWSTSNFLFDLITPLQVGQVLTVRAKSRGKNLSDRSVSYRIGGTPTPIDLGVKDAFGRSRPPNEGESSIAGKISYWQVEHTGPTREGLAPGDPIFDCRTDIFVYLDGVNVGKVERNTINGVNAEIPVHTSLEDEIFQLMVDGHIVTVPISIPHPTDIVVFDYYSAGSPDVFQFSIPATNVAVRVFRNGLRQVEGVDLNTTIDTNARLATVNLLFPMASTDTIVALIQYQSQLTVIGESLGPIDNSNDLFNTAFPIKAGTDNLYYNGGRIFLGVDYILVDSDTIQTLFVPQVGESLILDYQPETAPSRVFFTQSLVGTIDGTNKDFTYVDESVAGNIHVYRNLLLQAKGPNKDYEIDETTRTITFHEWSKPTPGDSLHATIIATPIGTTDLVAYLNGRPEFVSYCMTASILADGQLKISTPYTLEFGPQDTMRNILFGRSWFLSPGKDADGTFKFHFNPKTSYWRYTHSEPFLRLQHLSARAFAYGTVRVGECV